MGRRSNGLGIVDRKMVLVVGRRKVIRGFRPRRATGYIQVGRVRSGGRLSQGCIFFA